MPDSLSTVLQPAETYAGVVDYTAVEYQQYDWSRLFVDDGHVDVIAVQDTFASPRARAVAALAR
jgi:hypothetical protein